jgi:pimeloyl-ACP methyl ester carboxylesterase
LTPEIDMRAVPVFCLLAIGLASLAPAGAAPVAAAAGSQAAPAVPASVATTLAPLPAATETFTVGTLKVQRYGDAGRAMILIPGLECGPWEFSRTIDALKGDHRVYALTLAGFDGVPAPKPDPAAGNLMDRADASLLQLIRSHHITKPALIGHSLGGTLALRFAGEHARLLAGVVAVDGLPVFPFMDGMSREQRAAMAARMKARIAAMTRAEFKDYALGYMRRMGVIDPGLAAKTAKRLAKSDPKASGEYIAADVSADDRDKLKQASVPILEISPYYAPDFEQAAKRSGRPMISEQAKTAYYQRMLENAPDAKVVSISPARHFVMLDQPQKFQAALNRFIASLPRGAQP